MAMDEDMNIGQLIATGRLAEARFFLSAHVERAPNDAGAIALLGKLDFQLGCLDLALPSLEKASALSPKDSDISYSLATLHLAIGRTDKAVAEFERCVTLRPDFADAHYNLGCALRQDGRNEAAVSAFAATTALHPDDANAHFNLANTLFALGRADDAVAAYRATVPLAPQSPDLRINLGAALRAVGKPEEAEAMLREALRLRPDVHAHNELANLLAANGKAGEAEALYRQALRLVPLDPTTVVNLAVFLGRRNRLDDIAPLLERSVAAHPDQPRLWNSLGLLYLWQARLSEAEDALGRAVALQPDYGDALANLGTVHANRGDPAEATLWFRRALAEDPDNADIHSNLLFNLLHSPACSREELFEEHRRFGERQEALVVATQHPAPTATDAERRLRVGFVSPDFREHALVHFLEPALKTLDHRQVEVFLYYTRDLFDEVTERLRSYADHWRAVSGLSSALVAKLIGDDRIDILVDLAGHSAGNALPVFARKPAPIQMTWLGYPATTGLTRMDYRLLGRMPAEHERGENTEQLLSGGAVGFMPPADAPEVTPPPLLLGNPPMLGSMNRPSKISDACFQTWCRILREVPAARLTMMSPDNTRAEAEAIWSRRFAAEGIDFARIVIEPKCELNRFLEIFSRIDVALDPFPYSGGTTTMLTAWMGVPQISMGGHDNVGGTGAWTMTQMGFPDLVADSEDEYAAAAVDLLTSPKRLVQYRATARARFMMTLDLEGASIAKDLFDTLRAVWRNYVVAGEGA
jgi:predicted O-linked N-acetylglucosamine transferase (SPINDLY family)